MGSYGHGRPGHATATPHRCVTHGLDIEQAVEVVTTAPWALQQRHRVDRRDVPGLCADCALLAQAAAIEDELGRS